MACSEGKCTPAARLAIKEKVKRIIEVGVEERKGEEAGEVSELWPV